MLFSAGGVVAAIFIPVQLFLFGLAFPFGWLQAPSYDSLISLVRMPLVRIYLFVLCSLPLFHWAHRFRYTLYDGLKVKHLNELIFVLCYGGAIVGTVRGRISALDYWINRWHNGIQLTDEGRFLGFGAGGSRGTQTQNDFQERHPGGNLQG